VSVGLVNLNCYLWRIFFGKYYLIHSFDKAHFTTIITCSAINSQGMFRSEISGNICNAQLKSISYMRMLTSNRSSSPVSLWWIFGFVRLLPAVPLIKRSRVHSSRKQSSSSSSSSSSSFYIFFVCSFYVLYAGLYLFCPQRVSLVPWAELGPLGCPPTQAHQLSSGLAHLLPLRPGGDRFSQSTAYR